MTTKKESPRCHPRATLSRQELSAIKLAENRGKCNTIDFYGQGVSLYAKPLVENGKPKGGARGAIKGWSSASRRRMREYMLTHRPPAGYTVYGVTLTIPGPPTDPKKAKKAFANFARSIVKAGVCAIWRVEVQKRGQLHWHMIAGYRDGMRAVHLQWREAIDSLGPVTFEVPYGPSKIRHVESRMHLPGADNHAVDHQAGGDSGSWMRYLQDHASKSKQEQVGEDIGRHWGVIGRASFERVLPDKSVEMNDQQYARVLRVLQRLATPRLENPESVFGRSLARRVRRGSRGRSVWYSRPETIARIVAWATHPHAWGMPSSLP